MLKYRIKPIDPLISRDARQFGAGSPMHSLNWLTNTVIAGAVRTVLWKENENRDSRDTLEALKKIPVRGNFPILDGRIYFPRPLDIIKSVKDIYQIRPGEFPKDSGANMPIDELMPSFPDAEEDFKPEKLNAFWEKNMMIQWLMHGKNDFTLKNECTLSAPAQDERVHASINTSTGTSNDGKLFSTTGLDFIHRNGNDKTFEQNRFSQEEISVDINDMNLPARFIAPVGGERRLAEFSRHEGDNILWECPEDFHGIIEGNLRLVLASPAVFANGWFPDWIDSETLTGIIPNTNVHVKLISAVTERWQPVSGWSYERSNSLRHKPMRRAVPAGSVYFFKITDGTLDAKSVWLKSICLNEQDINDGFGLVLAGKW
jgi:CRISPR-associated protein Cmr3